MNSYDAKFINLIISIEKLKDIVKYSQAHSELCFLVGEQYARIIDNARKLDPTPIE